MCYFWDKFQDVSQCEFLEFTTVGIGYTQSQLKYSVIFISKSVSSCFPVLISSLFPFCSLVPSVLLHSFYHHSFFCLPACSLFISFTSPGFLFLCDSANSFWSQNTPSSSSIFKVEAIDKDTGSGGSITYFLQVKYCPYLHKSSLIY